MVLPKQAIINIFVARKMLHNLKMSFTALLMAKTSLTFLSTLPHFLFIGSVRCSEENTLTQAELHLAHSEPSQASLV